MSNKNFYKGMAIVEAINETFGECAARLFGDGRKEVHRIGVNKKMVPAPVIVMVAVWNKMIFDEEDEGFMK